MKELFTKICVQCNEVFSKDSRVSVRHFNEQTRYCSRVCMNKYWTGKPGRKLGKTGQKAWNKGKSGPRGAANPSWKGGITPLSQAIRTSTQYKSWRKAIFDRDDYACVWCKARCGEGKKVTLNADHIQAFSTLMRKHNIESVQAAFVCADLWSMANGRTLCVECHRKTSNYGVNALK